MVRPIHVRDTSPSSIRKTQAASYGLFDQGSRIGRAKRDDGVQIRNVPAFLEHIDVDNDLGRVRGIFDRGESCWTVSSFSFVATRENFRAENYDEAGP